MLINRCHPALSITNCQSSSPCHRTYHLRWPYEIRPEKSLDTRSNSKKKSAAPPFSSAFLYLSPSHPSINTTLAGVAQSVERVALITAKRSTSRSWVRAPPSAIPIIQAQQSSCSFAFCLFDHAGRFFALPSISVASQANSTIVPYNVRSSLASCMSFLLTRNQPSLGGLSLSSNQGTVTATTISDGCGNNDMKS